MMVWRKPVLCVYVGGRKGGGSVVAKVGGARAQSRLYPETTRLTVRKMYIGRNTTNAMSPLAYLSIFTVALERKSAPKEKGACGDRRSGVFCAVLYHSTAVAPAPGLPCTPSCSCSRINAQAQKLIEEPIMHKSTSGAELVNISVWELERDLKMAVTLKSEKQLNDGNRIPVLGLGTWRDSGKAVLFALKHGLRLIDTAALYG